MSEKPKYRNVFHGMYTIVKDNGPSGCYKGVAATLMKQSSNQAVRFLVFNDVSERLKPFFYYTWMANMLAGGFAGFCSTMANNPVDVIKTKMQGLDASKYNGVMHCAGTVMKESGPMGFYKGVGPRLARVVGDVALTFSIFHGLKDKITELLYG